MYKRQEVQNNKLNEIKTEIKSEFNCKFDVLKFDIDEVKMKCESSCNELKQDIERIVELQNVFQILYALKSASGFIKFIKKLFQYIN